MVYTIYVCYITSFTLTFHIFGSVANRNLVYVMNGKYY